jgi:hypothetical protein
MPTVTEVTVDGFISCVDPRCPGYEQKPVPVTRQNVAFTYGDNGGDGSIPLGATEREAVHVVQSDEACEHCGKPTIRSDRERPEHAQVSGQDPLALLNLNQQKQMHEVQLGSAQQAQAMAEMRAMLAEQALQMERMQSELQRRKGGRPPKTEDE